jgi:D-inositol-3-phosphate glycosyltransferase
MENNLNQQLHIALLSLHSCPCGKLGSRYTGGMNIYIKNLAAELIKQGHSVDIFTCSHEDDEHCRLDIPAGNVNLIHIQAEDFATISESNLDEHVSMLARSIIAYGISHDLHYDIVHSHYWLSGMVGDKLKNVWSIPHVTMFHTLGEIKNETGLGKVEPQYRIIREKAIIDSCDLIIASTGKEKNALVDKYSADPDKISVIPCGVNPEQFKPFNKQLAREICGTGSRNTMLFVGRADPVKGLDNLLEAISMLKHRDDFQLIIIGGDDSSMAGVKETISASGKYDIEGKIHLVGPVPNDRMYLYYNAADFCVIPSYYESFSLVALEAVACGIPILATDVGDVKDISRHCALCRIISSNNPQLLASNIDGLFDSIEKNADQKPYSLPCQYTWGRITEKIVDCYFTLIANTPPCKQHAFHL